MTDHHPTWHLHLDVHVHAVRHSERVRQKIQMRNAMATNLQKYETRTLAIAYV